MTRAARGARGYDNPRAASDAAAPRVILFPASQSRPPSSFPSVLPMNPLRPLLCLAAFVSATLCSGQTLATSGHALDDFSNYTLGEIIAGKGERGAWRLRGLNLAHSAQIVAVDGTHVLGFQARQLAIFDKPTAFSIPADGIGTVSFRIRLPGPQAGPKHDQAFFFIVKTREQADSDLTSPVNGLFILQFAYLEAERSYRLRLEGPGPSPTPALITPGQWHDVAVQVNMPLAAFQVWVTPPGGSTALVINHLYRDGVVPFKNRGAGAAELIYLRNQNLPATVEIDALRFIPSAAGSLPPR